MILATELRIGNKIRYSLHELTVSQIRNMGGEYVVTSEGIDGYLQEYDGIELTPEILNGIYKGKEFIELPNGLFFCDNGEDILLHAEDRDNLLQYPLKNVKYLHQLQNLYFALTGEELELCTPC